MSWTTEYPTRPGFYWIKLNGLKDWEIGYLDPEMSLHLVGNDLGHSPSIVAEWQGPIEPEEEMEKEAPLVWPETSLRNIPRLD